MNGTHAAAFRQFEAAMSTKGPRPIETQVVQNLKPVIDAVHNSRG